MFAFYPYLPSFHVAEGGLSGHVQADVRMVFWSVSVPAYDRYGFAGYQQTDFGENYLFTLGNSYLAYSTGKFAISLFYTNALSGSVKVDTLSYAFNFKTYGGGIAFAPTGWMSLGVDAVLTPDDRGGGMDFTFRYEYLAHLSGGLFYMLNSKRVVWDVSAFVALPDPRMSSLGLYASNRWKPSYMVRYETNITRNRRIKLGGGFIYDGTYAPVLSLGESERLGRYLLGADLNVFPAKYDYENMRVEWNDVNLSLWITF
ncbi:MAG: hypothetical protein GXO29_06095 [Thermotogae bacterium]|nr:hypothetical protein [Thermotogota bacterium]